VGSIQSDNSAMAFSFVFTFSHVPIFHLCSNSYIFLSVLFLLTHLLQTGPTSHTAFLLVIILPSSSGKRFGDEMQLFNWQRMSLAQNDTFVFGQLRHAHLLMSNIKTFRSEKEIALHVHFVKSRGYVTTCVLFRDDL
jgi:DMSO/TMAO reductase YedYZ heme-binding membrane subunit